ncbi:MAG TPA: sensor histidine kinase [Salinivirga sp.]|uniref:sensor histidine kinase n=1 Tax=Salinivirga sp. TaxID=1970192 RepID=UPI002B47CC65|nr:sensor histidine kinase [Salinivirga sp.]HKK60022.1 sensor histidine kinase [Salinivirga sp.]
MINSWFIIVIIMVYLGFLFFIAYWAEKNKTSKWVKSPFVYALSLAVYCSAWTYYGSVGVAARSGVEFLTIYLGPVIAAPLWIYILQKIIRLSKVYNISSIADFISLRYGNNRSVGAIVTLICALSIIPYISLQLKAVSESFNILTNADSSSVSSSVLFTDTTFYIAIILAVFSAFYGTLRYDASQQKRGLFFAVSVESVIKLVIFIVIGLYVSFYLFDSPGQIISLAKESFDTAPLTQIQGLEGGINWWFTMVLSFLAIFLLPRQFQASVVENKNKKQLHSALWVFPLYLLLFNLFVVFIAFSGKLNLGIAANADYYSLLLPLQNEDVFLAILVFIGGLSAIISMVVVSTLALSTMLSNNLIIPYGFIKTFQKHEHEKNQKLIKNIRRISVFLLIAIAFMLYRFVNPQTTLFSIGLLSFLLVAQLAPSFFVGMFWNRGSALGAKAGMLAGLGVVLIIYIFPFFQNTSFTNEVSSLATAQVFSFQAENLSFLSPVNNCFFWSLALNLILFLSFSLIKKGNYRERNYGEVFVNSSAAINMKEDSFVWKGDAEAKDIINLWDRFIGKQRAARALDIFKRRYKIDDLDTKADGRLVNFSEKLLTGAVGSASAKILISNVAKEQPVSLLEVLKILEENREAMASNKQLTAQSEKLIKLTKELKTANEALKQQDKLKDDFLNAVAHELKTPITSIQASSEVLKDNGDMPEDLKHQFLNNILFDTQRITSLINDILDLEKLASGRVKLNFSTGNLTEALKHSIDSLQPIANKKNIILNDCGINTPVNMMYDSDKMLQVFTNMLSNAVKFVEENTGEVKVKLKDGFGSVKIVIEDNGKGVPEIDRPYIFDKFYQSDNQAFQKNEGSGFGLAICKQIIDLHQGEIYLDDSFQQGARFIVELPKMNAYEKDTISG